MEEKVIYPELSYEIVGLLYSAHNELGRYANEKQYGDFIESKLQEHGIKYEREKVLEKYFPEEHLGRHRVDFLIEDKIIVELKCMRIFTKEAYYQVQRYLKVLDKKLGLLVNFRDKYLRPHRILNSQAPIRNS